MLHSYSHYHKNKIQSRKYLFRSLGSSEDTRYFLVGSWTEKGNVIKMLNNSMMYILQSISTFTAVAISRSYFPAGDFFELRYSLETLMILRDPALKWKVGLFPPSETHLKELELLCQLLSRIMEGKSREELKNRFCFVRPWLHRNFNAEFSDPRLKYWLHGTRWPR